MRNSLNKNNELKKKVKKEEFDFTKAKKEAVSKEQRTIKNQTISKSVNLNNPNPSNQIEQQKNSEKICIFQ